MMSKRSFSRSKFLIILGPTSTGKTDLALKLAKRFNGELVSCDSRQVYRGLDIGTGKMPAVDVSRQSSAIRLKKGDGFWEIDGVKIWMYDVVSPKVQYTVADYVKDAKPVIYDIEKRGKLPIIVGGTGLYLKALFTDLPNLIVPPDQKLRRELNNLTIRELQHRLQKTAPDKWNSLNQSDRQNPRRLIRAIEIATQTEAKDQVNINITAVGLMSTVGQTQLQNNILKIGLTAPREILYQKIDERVIRRVDQGMIDEAKNLHKHGLSFKRMKQLGLEYGVLADYLMGKITSKGELIKTLQYKIHGFARRQITWFKKEKNVNWFDIRNVDYLDKIEKLIRSWYDLGGGSYAKKS